MDRSSDIDSIELDRLTGLAGAALISEFGICTFANARRPGAFTDETNSYDASTLRHYVENDDRMLTKQVFNADGYVARSVIRDLLAR